MSHCFTAIMKKSNGSQRNAIPPNSKSTIVKKNNLCLEHNRTFSFSYLPPKTTHQELAKLFVLFCKNCANLTKAWTGREEGERLVQGIDENQLRKQMELFFSIRKLKRTQNLSKWVFYNKKIFQKINCRQVRNKLKLKKVYHLQDFTGHSIILTNPE